MAKRIARGLILFLVVIGGLLFAAWITSPDPQSNVASFEPEALVPGLAPMDVAITLAQSLGPAGDVRTLLVTALNEQSVEAVDLTGLTGSVSSDPFAVLALLTPEALRLEAASDERREYIPISELLSAAPSGTRHIGTGTNFPEHAEEASSTSVFQFPKFGAAMPARSSVIAYPDVILDYEVEFCMRFDRTVASVEDFDAAVKGLFLCGDFTDRSELVRLVDPDNLDSGRGFSDGKSREDFYPSGALLVIPQDWASFVREERMTTRLNGEERQDARGGEMTLDFRALTEKALGDMANPRFLYKDDYFTLAPESAIIADMTLMSGTAEGVIFTPPSRGDMIEGLTTWLFMGHWLQGDGVIASVIEVFIDNELASGHYLQPGDTVEHRSLRLGDIIVQVVPE